MLPVSLSALPPPPARWVPIDNSAFLLPGPGPAVSTACSFYKSGAGPKKPAFVVQRRDGPGPRGNTSPTHASKTQRKTIYVCVDVSTEQSFDYRQGTRGIHTHTHTSSTHKHTHTKQGERRMRFQTLATLCLLKHICFFLSCCLVFSCTSPTLEPADHGLPCFLQASVDVL